MGRLGHSPFAWGLLGLVLGPIALLLALVEVRNERPWWTRLVASGDPGSGPVDVLVGIDGSPESTAATSAALELFGDRVGRLTLVAVTEVDDSVAGREARSRLRGELERQAEAVRAWQKEQDVPAQAKPTVTPELPADVGPARPHPGHDRRRGRLRLAGGRGQRRGDVQCGLLWPVPVPSAPVRLASGWRASKTGRSERIKGGAWKYRPAQAAGRTGQRAAGEVMTSGSQAHQPGGSLAGKDASPHSWTMSWASGAGSSGTGGSNSTDVIRTANVMAAAPPRCACLGWWSGPRPHAGGR
jgi:hypothetical protein